MLPIVAIDGPAGAGKSTVARMLAKELSFLLVDTGAIYRTLALSAKRASVDWLDDAALGRHAEELVQRHAMHFEPDPKGGVRVLLDGEDVSLLIRTPEIALGASTVSGHPSVRAALLDLQRQAGAEGGVVFEGRDIGTVVFPNADCKFYLTATLDERARRRYDELVSKGEKTSLDMTREDVRKRDEQDSNRKTAPLRQAADAILIDSSAMGIDVVVSTMAAHVRSKITP